MQKSGISIFGLALACGSNAFGSTTSSVQIAVGLAADAARITIPLTVTADGGPNVQSNQLKSGPVPAALAEQFASENFKFHMTLGSDVTGRNYDLLLRPMEEFISLPSDNSRELLYQAAVVRKAQLEGVQGDAEMLTSGTLMGNSAKIPFKFQFPAPVGSNGLTEGAGTVSFNIHRSGGADLGGNATFTGGATATGSVYLDEARIHATIVGAGGSAPGGQHNVSLQLEPLKPGVPVLNSAGKMSDPHTLGGVKIAVDSLASDWSSITLAVVFGNVQAAATAEVENIASLPAVSQVELFERKLYSTSDLLAYARKQGSLLMIFGDFQGEVSQPHYGGQQNAMALSLADSAIIQTLQQAGEKAPAVAFVVRSVAVDDLYSTQLNQKPGYLVLSDFADATKVHFRSPPNPYQPHYYNSGVPTEQKATLRNKLKLPPDKVSMILFDANGKTVYHKADAGGDLQGALLEAISAGSE